MIKASGNFLFAMKTLAVGLNLVLVAVGVAVAEDLPKGGPYPSDFHWGVFTLLLLIAVLNLLVIVVDKAPTKCRKPRGLSAWLVTFFERKHLEERKRIEALKGELGEKAPA